MADDKLPEVDDWDDPEDDWDDPEYNWPAQRLDQLSGDAFGNGAKYLWRCELCGGYFLQHDPTSRGVFTVGLILYEKPPQQRMKEQHERWSRAERFLAEKICTCDFHHRSIGVSFH